MVATVDRDVAPWPPRGCRLPPLGYGGGPREISLRHPLLLAAVLGLSACGGDPLSCPYLSHPDTVMLGVTTLDANATATEDPFTAGPGEVLTTRDAWDAAVGRWGTDDGVSPDFATQVVYVYRWINDGCAAAVQYAAWADGESLRVVAVEDDSTSCSGDTPQIDLVVVDRGDATDLAWCANQ